MVRDAFMRFFCLSFLRARVCERGAPEACEWGAAAADRGLGRDVPVTRLKKESTHS